MKRTAMSRRKPSDIVNTKLRMREPLRMQIEQSAKERGTSMNAEINRRLAESFRDDEISGMFEEILSRLPSPTDEG